MTDLFVAIAFYVLAAIALVAGVGVVRPQNLVRAALLLVLVLGVVAGFYVLLSADFLAVVQVIVYVGAIMILMLFAIMLTPGQVDLPALAARGQQLAAALAALAVGAISLAVVLTTPWKVAAAPLNAPTTDALGALLLSTYVLPFEIISVLLTVAMIGAIVIARED